MTSTRMPLFYYKEYGSNPSQTLRFSLSDEESDARVRNSKKLPDRFHVKRNLHFNNSILLRTHHSGDWELLLMNRFFHFIYKNALSEELKFLILADHFNIESSSNIYERFRDSLKSLAMRLFLKEYYLVK